VFFSGSVSRKRHDEVFCANKYPAKGIYTAVKGKYTSKTYFLNVGPYIFSGALAKDSQVLNTCLSKLMSKATNKLTKKKTRLINNNFTLMENLNNTI